MYNPYFYQPQPQQIQRIAGEQSARQVRLAPNSSALFLDEREPIVWLCVSDGVGTVTPTPYDITPHVDKTQETIDNRLKRIEDTLLEMEKRYEPYVNAVNDLKSQISADKDVISAGENSPKSAGYVGANSTNKPPVETGYRNGRK